MPRLTDHVQGDEVVFTDISADSEDAWYTITAASTGDAALSLYCSSTAAVVSPSAAASQYHSSERAGGVHTGCHMACAVMAACQGHSSCLPLPR